MMYVGNVCGFFSSRRRHTRCVLVTGVQTCALPIWKEGETRSTAKYQNVWKLKRSRADPNLLARAPGHEIFAHLFAVKGNCPVEIGRASCRERVCQYV